MTGIDILRPLVWKLLQATNPNLIELQRLSSESARVLFLIVTATERLSSAGYPGPQLLPASVLYLNEPLQLKSDQLASSHLNFLLMNNTACEPWRKPPKCLVFFLFAIYLLICI